MSIVYLNGQYIPKEKAFISVDDRGFLFGDGIYEVTAAYHGKLFRWPRHVARAQKGLSVLRIDLDPAKLEEVHLRLLAENDLVKAPVAYVYLEVTRGVAPRTHAFPAVTPTPTVYLFAGEYHRPARERWEKGFSAVTVHDQRWARADVKTIQLLPNILGKQAAVDSGVDEIVYVRDGMAIEGALNNFFTVFGETVVTHPTSNQILPGICREVVLELCERLGYKVEHKAITVAEMFKADEAFHTGTLTEVKPCVQVDGRPIGSGKVGKVTRALFDAFLAEAQRG
ncbi:MAG TPA: aminotransferase class IV [Longimicrobiales bacterium]|nr:aminotransferase class IV [Longimicrobiales bacterium]